MSIWNEIPAVFGGAFDPPHLGHRQILQELLQEVGSPRVLILPSAHLPHKKTVATALQRLEMARLCFQEEMSPALRHRIEINEVEIEDQGSPHYTFHTLQKLGAPSAPLAFVIGADQLQALPSWHRFPEVLHLAHWLVLERKPDGSEKIAQTLAQWSIQGLVRRQSGPTDASSKGDWTLPGGTLLRVRLTQAPALSSQEIRATLVKKGQPPEDSLSPGILSYLLKHRLYGIQPSQEKK